MFQRRADQVSTWFAPFYEGSQEECRTPVSMLRNRKLAIAIALMATTCSVASAQPRRKVIINQDCSGPGGSNLQTLLVMIQSPQVEVLGITVVSGDQWRDEEVAHTLRLLEVIGRTDIPVVPGALFPLVHSREDAQLWQQRYGKVAYAGAWDDRWWHEPTVVPPLQEGQQAAGTALAPKVRTAYNNRLRVFPLCLPFPTISPPLKTT